MLRHSSLFWWWRRPLESAASARQLMFGPPLEKLLLPIPRCSYRKLLACCGFCRQKRSRRANLYRLPLLIKRARSVVARRCMGLQNPHKQSVFCAPCLAHYCRALRAVRLKLGSTFATLSQRAGNSSWSIADYVTSERFFDQQGHEVGPNSYDVTPLTR